MSDLERLARVEERIDMLIKHFERHEANVHDRLDEIRVTVKATINGRIETVEQRYALVRLIVFGACGLVLTAFFGAIVAYFIGAPLRPPTLPQPYSIQPKVPQ